MVGFGEVTPTISPKQQIRVVGLNTFIRRSKGKSWLQMDNSVQGLDRGLYYMKRFKNRRLKYSSTQSCQGETEITLLGMRIDTIL
jgi:hypothetical protein